MQKKHILELEYSDIKKWVNKNNFPPFRAEQIYEWIYSKSVLNTEKMTNLPKGLRKKLSENFIFFSSKVKSREESPEETVKFLIELEDGEFIETVLIYSPGRKTLCLSSQVGCPVKCSFCASGVYGLKRNLKFYEILEQFYHINDQYSESPNRIVLMGIGEPLLNFENVRKSMEIISSNDKIGLSCRNITISTSGYVPGIKKLADLEHPWNLAVSLHAPNDKLRAELIPGKFRFPIRKILEAAKYYREKTGRMFTIEYTLIKNLNCSDKHARKIAELAFKFHAKVNLIPYNDIKSEKFAPPGKNNINKFRNILKNEGVQCTVRQEKGGKAHSACGQLRIQV